MEGGLLSFSNAKGSKAQEIIRMSIEVNHLFRRTFFQESLQGIETTFRKVTTVGVL